MKRTLFHQSSMTEGPVLQGMLAFFLPIMLGTLLQQLYSAVDAVVLGQFVGPCAACGCVSTVPVSRLRP